MVVLPLRLAMVRTVAQSSGTGNTHCDE